MIRFFDIFLSAFGMLVLSPFFILIAILIKLDSRGPIYYRQIRVGRDFEDFEVLKFRTMKVGSDKFGLLTIGGKDSRVTKLGYFLRRYKLDELPQLHNVLIGDMSLVGPRPEVRKYVELYSAFQSTVLSVRPGITDWASIKYKDENNILANSTDPEKAYIEIVLPEKIKLNMVYIKNRSVFHYFKIIVATLVGIIK